ncbi:hypothetical protein L209DRAFT_425799 [Thermothelomyces heterothallicus CBS 203.75]
MLSQNRQRQHHSVFQPFHPPSLSHLCAIDQARLRSSPVAEANIAPFFATPTCIVQIVSRLQRSLVSVSDRICETTNSLFEGLSNGRQIAIPLRRGIAITLSHEHPGSTCRTITDGSRHDLVPCFRQHRLLDSNSQRKIYSLGRSRPKLSRITIRQQSTLPLVQSATSRAHGRTRRQRSLGDSGPGPSFDAAPFHRAYSDQ